MTRYGQKTTKISKKSIFLKFWYFFYFQGQNLGEKTKGPFLKICSPAIVCLESLICFPSCFLDQNNLFPTQNSGLCVRRRFWIRSLQWDQSFAKKRPLDMTERSKFLKIFFFFPKRHSIIYSHFYFWNPLEKKESPWMGLEGEADKQTLLNEISIDQNPGFNFEPFYWHHLVNQF